MTELEQILGKNINSIKELKDEIKRLQDSIANADTTSEEFVETSKKLYAAQSQVTAITRAGKDANDAAADSIAGMEKQYRTLYAAYRNFDEAYRKSAEGMAKAAELEELSRKLNEAKKEVGNFKDNIGHYSEGVQEAFKNMGISVDAFSGPFKAVIGVISDGGKGIQESIGKLNDSIKGIGNSLASMGGPAAAAKTALKGVGTAMKSLIANPVGATIMAIVVAFKALGAIVSKVKEAISKNEESQMRLREAMSAFQPVLDKVTNAWDKLGQMVVKVIGFVGDAFRKMREIRAAATDFLGITKGAKKRVKEENDLYKDIAQSRNKLILQKREYQELNAKDNAEVQRLREEASETENLQEKREKLTQAKEIQAQIDQRKIELAKEDLRLLQEEAALTPNATEDNERLAAAIAAVAQAEADAANNARAFNKQLKATTTSTHSAASAGVNYREKAKELFNEVVENSKTEVQKVQEKYEKEYKLLKKYHLDTKLLTIQYNKEMKKLYEDAAQKAAEAASAKFVKASQYEITKNDPIFSEFYQGIWGNMNAEIKKATAQQKKFNEFFRDFMSLPSFDGEYKEMAQGFVDDINEVLGTSIMFPPNPTPEAMKEFQEKLELTKGLFEKYIKELNATGKRLDIEREFELGYKGIEATLNKRISELLVTSVSIPIDTNLAEQDINNLLAHNQKYEVEMAKMDYEQLMREKSKYEQIMDIENLSYEERLEAAQNYYAVLGELRQKDLELAELSAEREQSISDAKREMFESVADNINNVIGAYSSLVQAEVNDGKITKREAEKKKAVLKGLEIAMLAVNLAQIAGSVATGIMDLYKSYAGELAGNALSAAAAGPGFAAAKAALDAKSAIALKIRTATLVAAGVANAAAATMGTISKIKSLNADAGSEGGSVSVAAAPAEINSNPYTLTRTLQTAEEEDKINRPIYVSVTDINEVQNRVKVVEQESTF